MLPTMDKHHYPSFLENLTLSLPIITVQKFLAGCNKDRNSLANCQLSHFRGKR